MVRSRTRPVIIDQADLPWEGWEDTDVAARSAIRWKLLIAGERTESAGIVTGIAEVSRRASGSCCITTGRKRPITS